MVSGGRDSRRVEQQEETSEEETSDGSTRGSAGSQPQACADAVPKGMLREDPCSNEPLFQNENELSPVPTRQPLGQEKVMGSILLTSKMELQDASDICTAHTTKLRSPLLRCPSDVDKFLLCKPMRSAGCQSITGRLKDSGKCGPRWPLCADLHLQVRLEGNFSRVGWRVG
ncbi:uncharacterized protein [Chlorocebus sabaeus]|uniref:uncharacterized protein isoform X1 n=1 Tax=Chlorocebus sabaeus TaxID=60711 RepID=UPI0018B09C0F|nr:uncharacterized protein LOC119621738 isoform X1 [Chlorocebus sabaeus]XP_037847524.1 uncharacterized protein LOC119621738 isoform X2 [Chlorocebus sabaeus]